MAIVRDDTGRVKGLITLEDVMEVLMGDVEEDEYDVLPSHIYQIAADRYIAGGGTSLATLKKKPDRNCLTPIRPSAGGLSSLPGRRLRRRT